MLTVLADSIYNILIFFAEKIVSSCKSYSHFFSKKFQFICISLDVNFNESLTNDIVSFEQLGPDIYFVKTSCVSCVVTETIFRDTSDDAQEMVQPRSTAFLRHQRKERCGTNKDKTNTSYEATEEEERTAAEEPPWNSCLVKSQMTNESEVLSAK